MTGILYRMKRERRVALVVFLLLLGLLGFRVLVVANSVEDAAMKPPIMREGTP